MLAMTGADLLAEYAQALARTSPADLEPLQKSGIGEAALATIKPAWAPIAINRDGLHFEPDPDAYGCAFIAPVRIDSLLSPEVTDPVVTVRGGGPPFCRFGAKPLYRWADCLAWARSRLSAPMHSTSEADAA